MASRFAGFGLRCQLEHLVNASFFLVNVVTFLTAGLDSGRFGWTGDVPVSVTTAGAALMLSGQVVFAMAKQQNAFFQAQ